MHRINRLVTFCSYHLNNDFRCRILGIVDECFKCRRAWYEYGIQYMIFLQDYMYGILYNVYLLPARQYMQLLHFYQKLFFQWFFQLLFLRVFSSFTNYYKYHISSIISQASNKTLASTTDWIKKDLHSNKSQLQISVGL